MTDWNVPAGAKLNNDTRREIEIREGRVTIVDVARRAGVSKSTVSLVLGGSSLVAETTRERVSDAMNELGYIYHRGAAAAPQLLDLDEPATAALCVNDVVAIGLTRALMEMGVSVGVDFDVIGFDDIEEVKHTLPALSSVSVNPRDLGSRAAQLLMRHIASGDFEPEAVLCPTTLALRDSCRAARPDDRGNR